jgi:hypothetical protein
MATRYSRLGFERLAAAYAVRAAERRAELQRLAAVPPRRRTPSERQRLVRLREAERARARIERRAERAQQRLTFVERMARLIEREAERGDSTQYFPGSELGDDFRKLSPQQQREIIQEHLELHEQYIANDRKPLGRKKTFLIPYQHTF